MVEEQRDRAPDEGAMIDVEEVQQLRSLAAMGWGAKRIAKELGVARNTVRRYLRGGDAALVQERPAARRLDEETTTLAVKVFHEEADGNAAVVHSILNKRGIRVGLRTVQRALADERCELRARQVATVRVETSAECRTRCSETTLQRSSSRTIAARARFAFIPRGSSSASSGTSLPRRAPPIALAPKARPSRV